MSASRTRKIDDGRTRRALCDHNDLAIPDDFQSRFLHGLVPRLTAGACRRGGGSFTRIYIYIYIYILLYVRVGCFFLFSESVRTRCTHIYKYVRTDEFIWPVEKRNRTQCKRQTYAHNGVRESLFPWFRRTRAGIFRRARHEDTSSWQTTCYADTRVRYRYLYTWPDDNPAGAVQSGRSKRKTYASVPVLRPVHVYPASDPGRLARRGADKKSRTLFSPSEKYSPYEFIS